ncbi:tryptophan halogenase family protein [Pseudoalteromonas fenneropenaei]|uniref:Tryptophan halogenase family protein n=1 Tax=Pseudoalteromonas fenneropenaei TaxID=1737459 RepID=A0ABV7CI71_9GAMM
MQQHKPQQVVVVGGGTAGWMTALICAKQWQGKAIAITLLEAQEIPRNGVGEGSTPALKRFFDWLEIPEAEWMLACDATFKAGIRFESWSGLATHPSYFHAFPNELDRRGEALFYQRCQARLKGAQWGCHPDDFFLASYLSDKQLAPKPEPHFPFLHSYGYHFDANKVAHFLQQKAPLFGVVHRYGRITAVESAVNGDIAALVLENGERMSADLFIDCSGFRSLLLGQHLRGQFQSYQDVLFNDTAITLATDVDTQQFYTCTTSTALSAGWVWRIPLTSRVGNGYVYSSSHISDEQAAIEFRQHLGVSPESEVRKLTMKVGRYEQQWLRNCMAIGLSQGFIEPLEATGLFVIQQSAAIFAKAYLDGGLSDAHRDYVNSRLRDMFDGIKDYIVAHYKTTSRQDTQYWRDNQAGLEKVSPSLQQLLASWYEGKDLQQEIARQNIAQFYSPMSWYSLLSGMGLFPSQVTTAPEADQALLELGDYYQRCCLNYANHVQYLEKLRKHHAVPNIFAAIR